VSKHWRHRVTINNVFYIRSWVITVRFIWQWQIKCRRMKPDTSHRILGVNFNVRTAGLFLSSTRAQLLNQAMSTFLHWSVAMLMICHQSMQSLVFLHAEWILLLADCMLASIPVSQVVYGHPQGFLQWLVGQSKQHANVLELSCLESAHAKCVNKWAIFFKKGKKLACCFVDYKKQLWPNG